MVKMGLYGVTNNFCETILTVLYTIDMFSIFSCLMLSDVGLRNTRNPGTIERVETGVGFIMCARKCEQIPTCTGFNFEKFILRCELIKTVSQSNSVEDNWWFVENISWLKEKGLSSGAIDVSCGIARIKVKLSNNIVHCLPPVYPVDCQDAASTYNVVSNNVYRISPTGTDPMQVYCDLQTDGGGWTVIQSRKDGSVDFYRGWTDYKNGFGDATGEYWLGNDNIHTLLSAYNYTMRVDMEYHDGVKYYAKYSTFNVADESEKYQLTVDGYSGDAGDAFADANGMKFSANDADNDLNGGHCSQLYKGGWWYNSCYKCNLNALYFNTLTVSTVTIYNTAANWLEHNPKRTNYPLKIVDIKVRRK